MLRLALSASSAASSEAMVRKEREGLLNVRVSGMSKVELDANGVARCKDKMWYVNYNGVGRRSYKRVNS